MVECVLGLDVAIKSETVEGIRKLLKNEGKKARQPSRDFSDEVFLLDKGSDSGDADEGLGHNVDDSRASL